jgi:tetratricopeptide (TPR) repeat protein
MVSDVASLWILALVVTVLILGLVFRKAIASRIERGGVKVQRGDLSLEIEPGEMPSHEAEVRGQEADPAEATLVPDDREPAEPLEPADRLAHEEAEGAEEAREPSYLDVLTKLREGDLQEARRIFDKAFEFDQEDERERQKHEAFFAFTRLQWGNDAEALKDLQEASAVPEVAAFAHNLLGQVWEDNGSLEKALGAFATASGLATDPADRATAITGESRCMHALGDLAGATQRLAQALAMSSDDDESRKYYAALASVFQKDGDWLSRAVALEKLLELRPNDISRRFDAGYSYSQAGREELAALHYRALLRLSPDHAYGSNNLGVAYQSLSQPVHAVKSYKRSVELENSLAGANLANVYLNAGLVEEAKAILEKAGNWRDPHPNVATNLARALRREEEEQAEVGKILEKAQREQQFSRHFAEARFVAAEPATILGTWIDDSGTTVELTLMGSDFEATFQGDNKTRLTGSVINRALLFDVSVEAYSLTLSQMAFEKRGTGRGYVADDGHIHLRYNERDREREMEIRPTEP